MAELISYGQDIVFRHPVSGKIHTGIGAEENVVFLDSENKTIGTRIVKKSRIKQWCDAESVFKEWELRQVRAGNFEWNEGPTVEPIK